VQPQIVVVSTKWRPNAESIVVCLRIASSDDHRKTTRHFGLFLEPRFFNFGHKRVDQFEDLPPREGVQNRLTLGRGYQSEASRSTARRRTFGRTVVAGPHVLGGLAVDVDPGVM
jgi:hypothetical protein